IPKSDKAAAWAWLDQELNGQAAGVVRADGLTFRQLTEFYLEEAEKSLGAETYARRVEHLDRFGSWPAADNPRRMDLRLARSLTQEDVERFLRDCIASGCSASYVTEGLLKSLKACLSWASQVRPGRFPGLPLPLNPLAKMKGPAV